MEINHTTNRYAWYQTGKNPPCWSLGEWDGFEVTNIRAQVKRDIKKHLWFWTAFLEQSGSTAIIPRGDAAIFEVARVEAEKALRAEAGAQE